MTDDQLEMLEDLVSLERGGITSPVAGWFNQLEAHRICSYSDFCEGWSFAEERGAIDRYLRYITHRVSQLKEKERAENPTGVLTKAWTQFATHAKQQAFWKCDKRFIVLPCGRRSGKTAFSKRKFIKKVMREGHKWDRPWYIAAAPTHAQAKRIYWHDFKSLVPPDFIQDKSEGELVLRLKNGADIQVMGMDVPERAEGRSLNGVLLDEYGNMKPSVWSAHLRPALADRGGFAWLIGAPEGRNHYYDTWCDARADDTGQWGAFTWTTEEVLPLYLGEEQAKLEIMSAMNDMDQLTYEQEYRASFVVFAGLAYYAWSDSNTQRCEYNKTKDLILMFDFNVAPGICIAGHETRRGTEIHGEVYIPNNSNTPRVCKKLIEVYGKHEGDVYLYGDATGGAKGTAKVDGSDWDIIKRHLRPVFGDRLRVRVDASNPAERQRVNAVNSRLCAVDGTRRLFVDKSCKWTTKDFEGVRVIEGTAGEIDKDYDARLTHITDAIGYYVFKKFPVAGGMMMNRSI
jgi:hypothetical protein